MHMYVPRKIYIKEEATSVISNLHLCGAKYIFTDLLDTATTLLFKYWRDKDLRLYEQMSYFKSSSFCWAA